MQIRHATIADAQNIAQVHVASWQAAYRGQMPDAILDHLNLEKHVNFWRTHLNNQSLGTFIAELNQAIIGFCDLIPSRDKGADPQMTGEIAAIYVHPEHWRQGAGRALCLCALETARSARFTTVTLWALKSNAAAQRFYEALGFHLDGAAKSQPIQNYELEHVRFRISL